MNEKEAFEWGMVLLFIVIAFIYIPWVMFKKNFSGGIKVMCMILFFIVFSVVMGIGNLFY